MKYLDLEDLVSTYIKPTTTNTDTNRFEKIATELRMFTSLKKLSVIKQMNKSIYQLDTIIECCPLLNCVNFQFDLTGDSSNNAADMADLSLIRTRPDIHTFSGNIMYSDQSVRYFIKKFPNLKTLSLHSTAGSQYYYSKDVMMEFFNYALNKRSIADKIMIDDVYSFMISFMENARFTGTVTIAYKREQGQMFNEPIIQLDSRSANQKITLTYTTSFNVRGYTWNDLPIQSHKVLIDKAANLIHHLHLQGFDQGPYLCYGYLGPVITKKLIDEDYLTCVLRDCTSLKTLTLKNSAFNNYSISSTTVKIRRSKRWLLPIWNFHTQLLRKNCLKACLV